MAEDGREQIKRVNGKFGNNLAGKKREREFQGHSWVSG